MRAFSRGRGTSRAIDLRAGDRHPLPSVRALVAGCGEQTEELLEKREIASYRRLPSVA
jgi:hypothetical protein